MKKIKLLFFILCALSVTGCTATESKPVEKPKDEKIIDVKETKSKWYIMACKDTENLISMYSKNGTVNVGEVLYTSIMSAYMNKGKDFNHEEYLQGVVDTFYKEGYCISDDNGYEYTLKEAYDYIISLYDIEVNTIKDKEKEDANTKANELPTDFDEAMDYVYAYAKKQEGESCVVEFERNIDTIIAARIYAPNREYLGYVKYDINAQHIQYYKNEDTSDDTYTPIGEVPCDGCGIMFAGSQSGYCGDCFKVYIGEYEEEEIN